MTNEKEAKPIKHPLINLAIYGTVAFIGMHTIIYLHTSFACPTTAHSSLAEALNDYLQPVAPSNLCMSFNEWGDTLAGMFAPIAFL